VISPTSTQFRRAITLSKKVMYSAQVISLDT
jgi:hypothetical protein